MYLIALEIRSLMRGRIPLRRVQRIVQVPLVLSCLVAEHIGHNEPMAYLVRANATPLLASISNRYVPMMPE